MKLLVGASALGYKLVCIIYTLDQMYSKIKEIVESFSFVFDYILS